MSRTETYFKIKNGLQFDDGTHISTAPISFSGDYNDLINKPTFDYSIDGGSASVSYTQQQDLLLDGGNA